LARSCAPFAALVAKNANPGCRQDLLRMLGEQQSAGDKKVPILCGESPRDK